MTFEMSQREYGRNIAILVEAGIAHPIDVTDFASGVIAAAADVIREREIGSPIDMDAISDDEVLDIARRATDEPETITLSELRLLAEIALTAVP